MRYRTPLLCSLLALVSPVVSADPPFTITAGLEYSTGDYGSSTDTRMWYYPLVAKYESDPWTVKLTVPYLKISGPANVVGGPEERVQLGQTTTAVRTDSGLGDVVAAATYNAIENRNAALLIDVTGKMKFATADERKGLGTGENDYALQLDVTKAFGHFSTFGSIGKKKLGDPPGLDLKDPWYANIGGAYKFSTDTTTGLSYDYRERIQSSGSIVSEATLFVTQKLMSTTKLQAYFIAGFADGSPDHGVGLMFSASF